MFVARRLQEKSFFFLIDCKFLCLKSYDKQTPARTIIRNVVKRIYATRSQLREKSLLIFSCAMDPSAFSFLLSAELPIYKHISKVSP